MIAPDSWTLSFSDWDIFECFGPLEWLGAQKSTNVINATNCDLSTRILLVRRYVATFASEHMERTG